MNESHYLTCDDSNCEKAYCVGRREFEHREKRLRALCEKLAEALEGFGALIDDHVLVRNTDDDSEFMKFMKQGARITGHLSAVQSALAEYRKLVGEP